MNFHPTTTTTATIAAGITSAFSWLSSNDDDDDDDDCGGDYERALLALVKGISLQRFLPTPPQLVQQ